MDTPSITLATFMNPVFGVSAGIEPFVTYPNYFTTTDLQSAIGEPRHIIWRKVEESNPDAINTPMGSNHVCIHIQYLPMPTFVCINGHYRL